MKIIGDPETIYENVVLYAPFSTRKIFHLDAGDLYETFIGERTAVLDLRTTVCGLIEGNTVEELGFMTMDEAKEQGFVICKRCEREMA